MRSCRNRRRPRKSRPVLFAEAVTASTHLLQNCGDGEIVVRLLSTDDFDGGRLDVGTGLMHITPSRAWPRTGRKAAGRALAEGRSLGARLAFACR